MTTASKDRAILREAEIRFDTQGATLAGATLAGTVCRRVGSDRAPAVLLLTGSGPLDRDGSHPRLKLDVSRQLAHDLARHGIASLATTSEGSGPAPATGAKRPPGRGQRHRKDRPASYGGRLAVTRSAREGAREDLPGQG
jgi:hypothetical protein